MLVVLNLAEAALNGMNLRSSSCSQAESIRVILSGLAYSKPLPYKIAASLITRMPE